MKAQFKISRGVCLFVGELLISIICKVIQDSLIFWIPRRGFWIPDNGFGILCQWNLDSGFGFRIPIVRGILHSFSCISDSANENSSIPGIRIPLNGAKCSSLVIYSSEMVGYETVKMMSAQFWLLTWIRL